MRLVRYESGGKSGIGVHTSRGTVPTGETDLASFFAESDPAGRVAQALTGQRPITVDRLLPPLAPGKILCAGVNYGAHLEENPQAVRPEEPTFFSKLPSAVIGPDEPVVLPYAGCQVDYEVELAVVIGRTARGLAPADALSAVFGYVLLNDVSARDIQFRNGQLTLGKGLDTFCPVGPGVVLRAAIPDPGQLTLTTRVNGEVLQRGTTSDMIFDLPTLLSHLTAYLTLYPGDIVSTGTPAGVAAFRPDHPYLQPGDVVEVACEQIGVLRNPVRAGWM